MPMRNAQRANPTCGRSLVCQLVPVSGFSGVLHQGPSTANLPVSQRGRLFSSGEEQLVVAGGLASSAPGRCVLALLKFRRMQHLLDPRQQFKGLNGWLCGKMSASPVPGPGMWLSSSPLAGEHDDRAPCCSGSRGAVQ